MAFASNRKMVLWLCTVGCLSLAGFYLAWYNCRSVIPERPMFHNHYGLHPDHGFIQQWWPELPADDKQGNLIWADFDDNVLVLLLQSVPFGQHGQVDPLSAGTTVSRFRLTSGKLSVVQRCMNELIVIEPTGNQWTFPLGKGLAEKLFKEIGLQVPDDLLIVVGFLLSQQDKLKIQAIKVTPLEK